MNVLYRRVALYDTEIMCKNASTGRTSLYACMCSNEHFCYPVFHNGGTSFSWRQLVIILLHFIPAEVRIKALAMSHCLYIPLCPTDTSFDVGGQCTCP